MRYGAFAGALVIALIILLTWGIIAIVENTTDDSDSNDSGGGSSGDATAESDLQSALDDAEPGTVINIGEGEYEVSLTTKNHGTEDDPIRIRGLPGTDPENVILKGDGDSRILQILHNHYIIEDFTIDGEVEEGEEYQNILIYVQGTDDPEDIGDDVLSSVTDVVIRNMILRNAGQECVRLQYYVTYSELYENDISNCGVLQFQYDEGGNNGEGIYIGTSTDQWDDKSDGDPDVCYGNYIGSNTINTLGSEGIDIKEGTTHTTVYDNTITGQREEGSGGIAVRGDNNYVLDNDISDAYGACIRVGGDVVSNVQYGVDNEIYDNYMADCLEAGLYIAAEPQIICQNEIIDPDDPDSDYAAVRGDGADDYQDYDADCDDLSPIADIPAPTPDSTPQPTPHPVSSPTSPPAATSSIDGYVGCYADDEDDRVFDLEYTDEDGMTVEDCIACCASFDKTYAALQYGKECWCGNEEDYGMYGEGDCDRVCTGDSDHYCGGVDSFSLYEVDGDEDYDDDVHDNDDDGDDDDDNNDNNDNNDDDSSCCSYDNDDGTDDDGSHSTSVTVSNVSDDDDGVTTGSNASTTTSDSPTVTTTVQTTETTTTDEDTNTTDDDGTTTDRDANTTDDDGTTTDEDANTTDDDGTTATAADGSEYLGCFRSYEGSPIIPFNYTDADLTPNSCVNSCRSYGEQYAGMGEGINCHCGTVDDYNPYGTTSCTSECGGDSNLFCGSPNALSIYEVY